MVSGNQGPDRESDWPRGTKNKHTSLVSQNLQPGLGASVILNCLKETRHGTSNYSCLATEETNSEGQGFAQELPASNR